MDTLTISRPYIRTRGTKSRLCADVTWPGRSRTIWFEVDGEYEPFLCAERADAFLVALLPFAMLKGYHVCSKACVSEILCYQITSSLIPSLTANIRQFARINIDAASDGKPLDSAHGVATALSCGVDSFYTVLKHIHTGMPTFDLTHLTYFNIMNHWQWKQYGEDSSREFSIARVNYVRPAAQELGLKLVAVDSNLDLLYRDHSLLGTYTFRYMGTALAVQKLFRKYYWSAGYPVAQFAVTFDDLAACDLLTVRCVSNENTTFYSTGSEVTRLEKTAAIADSRIAQRYLNVCWSSLRNCTDKCDKCRRTSLALYALNKLDLYREVFDVDRFYTHIHKHLGYMLAMRRRETHHSFYDEVYRQLEQRGARIDPRARSYAGMYQLNFRIRDLLEGLKSIAREHE